VQGENNVFTSKDMVHVVFVTEAIKISMVSYGIKIRCNHKKNVHGF
jgi:hypothetical protein